MRLNSRFVVQVLHLSVSLLLTFDLVEDWFNLNRGTLMMVDSLMLSLWNITTALAIWFLWHIVRLPTLHKLVLCQRNQGCSIFESCIILLNHKAVLRQLCLLLSKLFGGWSWELVWHQSLSAAQCVWSPIFFLYLSQVKVVVALALAEVVIICGLVWHLLLGVY